MIFPAHKCSLSLKHNENRSYYQTVAQYISDSLGCGDLAERFESPEAMQRAIDTNEIWELQYYPDTPIGFYRVCAPTLEEVLALALQCETESLAQRAPVMEDSGIVDRATPSASPTPQSESR